jgi:hypothetical protein
MSGGEAECRRIAQLSAISGHSTGMGREFRLSHPFAKPLDTKRYSAFVTNKPGAARYFQRNS